MRREEGTYNHFVGLMILNVSDEMFEVMVQQLREGYRRSPSIVMALKYSLLHGYVPKARKAVVLKLLKEFGGKDGSKN